VDAAEGLLQRVLADGGVALNFDQLDPEEYLTAAREANSESLATVGTEVAFDPASPWVDAGSVIETLEQYRPRRARRERPPDPPPSPDADPIARIRRNAEEAVKRRSLRAESLLSGENEVDLTDGLRAAGWPGAGRILADLFMLDAAEAQPYRVKFSDALHVDAEAPLSYVSPATLRAERAAAVDLVADDLNAVAGERAA
jgi:hypothetical protein